HAEYGEELVNHRTWVLASDGDLMEGVSHKAAAIAGHLKLGKLTVIWDDNSITIDGRTDLSFSENVMARFESYGWRTLRVNDGNDLEAIDTALADAGSSDDRPTLIALRTVIADPAPTKRDTAGAHGAPLGDEEISRTREIMGWPDEPFHVPADAYQTSRELIEIGNPTVAEWNARVDASPRGAELRDRIAGKLPANREQAIPDLSDKSVASRQSSQQVLGALAEVIPALVGGDRKSTRL